MSEKKNFPPKKEYGEDTTKYGEYVCSAYHWLPLEKQKEQAKRLESITDKSSNRKKK